MQDRVNNEDGKGQDDADDNEHRDIQPGEILGVQQQDNSQEGDQCAKGEADGTATVKQLALVIICAFGTVHEQQGNDSAEDENAQDNPGDSIHISNLRFFLRFFIRQEYGAMYPHPTVRV